MNADNNRPNASVPGDVSREDLMRLLDGETAPEESKAMRRKLEKSSELRREFAIFKGMKAQMQQLSFVPPRAPGSSWSHVRKQITQPLGWALVGAGTTAWLGYGAWVLATSPTAVVAKLATSAVAIGILVLLAEVVLARVQEYKTDPYKDVHR